MIQDRLWWWRDGTWGVVNAVVPERTRDYMVERMGVEADRLCIQADHPRMTPASAWAELMGQE